MDLFLWIYFYGFIFMDGFIFEDGFVLLDLFCWIYFYGLQKLFPGFLFLVYKNYFLYFCSSLQKLTKKYKPKNI